MLNRSMIGSLVAATVALPAIAQESYVVGLTGAITGPAASTFGPAVEGLRLYVDKLNASGGVNGHKIQLILQDDSAEPSKAAANVKKLLSQDNVSLLINTSLSSTYAPMLAETHSAQVPVMCGRCRAARSRAAGDRQCRARRTGSRPRRGRYR